MRSQVRAAVLEPRGKPRRPSETQDLHRREAQIIAVLHEADAGVPVKQLCGKHGITPASFYAWKRKYGGMDVGEAKRLKARAARHRVKPEPQPLHRSLSRRGGRRPRAKYTAAHVRADSRRHGQLRGALCRPGQTIR
ncbi:MAG: transposase [Myxococcales bacterium FL481]|nr:MAG: transposase [Myxococcales bacterium FL481]